MLTYGPVAFSNASSAILVKLFAVAGFAVKDNPNFDTIADGVKAAKGKADIVVLVAQTMSMQPLLHKH